MKRLVALAVASALGLSACQKAAPPAAAVDPAVEAATAKWAALAKLPDWSGVWEPDWRGSRAAASGQRPQRPQMKLTPEYQAKQEEFRKGMAKGENLQGDVANCVPPGLPGMMTQPYPIEFLFQPDKVVLLTEAYMQYRHIWTDGRALPEDPDLTFNGSSVGRWEGDTLVVDTVGFAPQNRLAPGVGHSDKLKITERIRKVEPGWIEIQTTMDDPAVFTEPYTVTTSYKHLDDEIREYICQENNRDGADSKGRPSFNLE